MSMPDIMELEYIGRLSTEKFYFDFAANKLYARLSDSVLHYGSTETLGELNHARLIMLREEELQLVNKRAYDSRLERILAAMDGVKE